MYLKSVYKKLALLASLATQVHCGSLETMSGSVASESVVEGATLTGLTEINFDADNQAVIQFSEVDPEDEYILAIYSSNNTTSETFSLSLSTLSDGNELSGSSVTTSALMIHGDDSENETEELHHLLRDFEEGLDGELPLQNQAVKTAVSALTVGSRRTFKVLDDFSQTSSYETVTAELRYMSDNFYAYVDTRNESALNDDDLNELLSPFDELIDEERNLFGDESDVNGDDHFIILLTQGVNELGAIQGGIISGFFFGADLYSADSYPVSNEMEIVYSMVPDPTGSFGATVSKEFALLNILPSVFPHELQHMINYNQHVFVNGGASEKSFLNEGLSHLAEDIYSMVDGTMNQTGIENPARSSLYLDSTSSVCFTCGSNISQRGGAYLFIRYLYEQAQKGNFSAVSTGGEWVDRLLGTNLTGVDNLVSASLDSLDPSRFKELIASFSATLYLTGTGLTNDNHYELEGLSLRDFQDDNRGTILDGPDLLPVQDFPYHASLVSSGVAYLHVTGEDILNAGSILTLSLGDGMEGGAFIIELSAE